MVMPTLDICSFNRTIPGHLPLCLVPEPQKGDLGQQPPPADGENAGRARGSSWQEGHLCCDDDAGRGHGIERPDREALCSFLGCRGHHVVRVVRRPVRPGEFALAWDPEAGTIDCRGLEGADAVVHLAGAGIADGRWTDLASVFSSRPYPLHCAARRDAGWSGPPARVLVSASAIGFYGDRGDEILTEQAHRVTTSWPGSACAGRPKRPRPRRWYQGGLRSHRHRLEEGGGALPKLLPLFKLGLGGGSGPVASGGAGSPSTTRSGRLRGCWRTTSRAGDLTAPHPVTNREFTRILGAVLSRPARLPVPRFGPRLLLGSELADALLLPAPGCSPHVLESSGFAFSYSDLEAGLRAMLNRPGS